MFVGRLRERGFRLEKDRRIQHSIVDEMEMEYLKGEDSLWINILRERYESLNHLILCEYGLSSSISNSSWWKEFVPWKRDIKWTFFYGNCRFSLGNGLKFCFSTSIGSIVNLLKICFRLYSKRVL